MSYRSDSRFRRYRVLAASVLLLSAAAVSGCAKSDLQSRASVDAREPKAADEQARKVKLASNSKIELNRREMGTTGDTSRLTESLKDILSRREHNKTIYIRGEDALKASEVIKVIEAVEVAGATTVRMPLYILTVKAPDARLGYDRLLVTIGDVASERMMPETGEIDLYLTEFTLKRSEKGSIPKDFVVAEISDRAEYIVDGNPTARSALKRELRARFQGKDHKRLVILLEEDSEVTYSSLEELACAAFEGEADLIQLLRLAQ